MKLYYFLFETGPSAQSAIPTLVKKKKNVSRLDTPALERGYLDIVDTMGLDLGYDDDYDYHHNHDYNDDDLLDFDDDDSSGDY